jgi:hypothetical protein
MAAFSSFDDDVFEPVPVQATIPAFDLDNPQSEEAYGSVNQGLITGAMIGTNAGSRIPERNRYYQKPEQLLKLSQLQGLYNRREGGKAFRLLKTKYRLDVDPSFYEDGTSQHFAYRTAGHHIDFSLKVPDRIGFDVILPPPSINVNTTWCFHLNLLGSARPFLNHRGDLGFDPTGRMLFVGTHDHDNIFLAMAPRSFLDGDDDPIALGTQSESTQMTRTHIRMATCIILWAMGRIPNKDYSTRDNYYIDLYEKLDQYKAVTDWV